MTQGSIYKLVSNIQGDTNIYVGSTKGTLRLRKSAHKTTAKKNPNRPVYKYFNNVGWDNVSIILVELVEFNTREELLARERHWIDLMGNLNKQKPLQDDRYRRKLYAQTDKEKKRKSDYAKSERGKKQVAEYAKTDKSKQYHKEYYINNVERIKQAKLDYADTEKGKQWAKEYYNINRDKMKEKNRIANKVIHLCDCGNSGLLVNKIRHNKSIKHLKYQIIVDFIYS
jgi:hypothetical protein